MPDLSTLTSKFRSLADSRKCKQLCQADAATLTAETGVQWFDNSFSIDISFQQPLSREEITSFLTSNPNLFDLAPGVQQVVTSNAQGGKITVSVPQNNLRSKIVDCPTLITALCLSVDVPTQVGLVRGKLYDKAKLGAAGSGFEIPDPSVNSDGIDAFLDVGVSANLALKPFMDAFTAELSLGCDYVITTQALNRIGARVDSVVTGASSSKASPYQAAAVYNRQNSEMYFSPSALEENCGDCCEKPEMAHREYDASYLSQSLQGQYGGCYPIPICLMIFPDTSVGFSLLLNSDAFAYEAFLRQLANDDPDLVEDQGSAAYATTYSTEASNAGNAAITVRVGTSACFDPTRASNPASTYIEVVVPAAGSAWLPCEATGAKLKNGGGTEAVSRHGIQVVSGGNVVASIVAGNAMSDFGGLTVANRETRQSAGEIKPRNIKVGNFRFKIDFVGARLSATSAYMLMYNVFGCPVDGAPSATAGLPGEETRRGAVDTKMLLEAYQQYGGQIDKYLRNPFMGQKAHPLGLRGNSLAGLLGQKD